MIGRLVLAELLNRPGRALLLLLGYAFGVAVMVVLLAVGEAMLSQARNEELLGGGDAIVLPAGISPEMLRAGGATSLFLGLDQARFLHRQVLESPRARDEYGIASASPIVDGRAVEISRGGQTVSAIASAEIPSRAEAAGAIPDLLAGAWTDSDADAAWAYPTRPQLLNEIDRFHLPYGTAAGDSTWAEWHYFNFVLDEERWLYLTFLIGGEVGTEGRWGGQLLASVREPRIGHRSYARDIPAAGIVFDTTSANLTLDPNARVELEGDVYRVRGSVDGVEVDVRLRPLENRLFPPASLGGPDVVSGYTVPALAARAEGRICLPASGCREVEGIRAYHDHNWGVWQDVAWEWGAASDDEVSLLYGNVRGPGIEERGIFVYLVDGEGVRGLYRPAEVDLQDVRPVRFEGREIRVPGRLHFEDPRRGLSVDIAVRDYQITDMDRATDRYFLQMAGTATVREAGREPRELTGFFETYVD